MTAIEYQDVLEHPELGFILLTGSDETGLRSIDIQRTRPSVTETPNVRVLAQTKLLLKDYFEGKAVDFSQIPLAPNGTAFQKQVWQTLLKIPKGQTQSYKWVAQQVGKPSAYRAVGQANGKNPIPIVIPCHRVVSHDGSLGGYSGGLDVKRFLLKLEAAC